MGIQINKVKPEMLKALTRKYLDEALETGGLPQGKKWPINIESSFTRAAILYFCNSCGNELYGYWEKNRVGYFDVDLSAQHRSKSHDVCGKANIEYENAINREIYWMQSLRHCPICGQKLSHEAGYYIEAEPAIVPELIKNPIVPERSPKEPWIRGKYFYGQYALLGLNGTTYQEWRNKAPIRINIGKLFDAMREFRVSSEEATAKREADHFIELCDVSVQTSAPQETIDKIKSNTTDLKDYVLHLIKLESSIHSINQRLNMLYLQRIPIDRKVVASRCAPAVELKGKIEEAELKYQAAVTQRERAEKETPKPIELEIPQKPTPPVLEKPGFFNKKSVITKNEALQMQYQADLAEYTLLQQNYLAEKARLEQEAHDKLEQRQTKAAERVAATQKELERLKGKYEECVGSNSEKSTPASQVKALFDKEINDAEDLLRNLYKCRNELYSYGVVYEKYHNVVAVSTFYEYLMSGRCEALEGVNGAYNLYESELRADLIIGRLDQITETLEQIRDNQYTLYSEMKKTNTHLSNLQYTMDEVVSGIDGMKAELKDISENTKVIAYNTEVTAYYTKMTAELTNAMGYMVAFK